MSNIVCKELMASNQLFEILSVCDRLHLRGGGAGACQGPLSLPSRASF